MAAHRARASYTCSSVFCILELAREREATTEVASASNQPNGSSGCKASGIPDSLSPVNHEPLREAEKTADRRKAVIVTWHGEHATLWHVVDPTAPEEDQPAIIRTFSSLNSTREDVRRFLGGLVCPAVRGSERHGM
jgi:hypothetical protein